MVKHRKIYGRIATEWESGAHFSASFILLYLAIWLRFLLRGLPLIFPVLCQFQRKNHGFLLGITPKIWVCLLDDDNDDDSDGGHNEGQTVIILTRKVIYLQWTRFQVLKNEPTTVALAAAAACVWYGMIWHGVSFGKFVITLDFSLLLSVEYSHRVRRYDSWIRCYQIEMTHPQPPHTQPMYSFFPPLFFCYGFALIHTVCLSLFNSWWRSLFAYTYTIIASDTWFAHKHTRHPSVSHDECTHTSTHTHRHLYKYGRDWHFMKSTQFLYNSVMCVRACVCMSVSFLFAIFSSSSSSSSKYMYSKNRSFFSHFLLLAHTNVLFSILINFFSVFINFTNFNIFFSSSHWKTFN